MAGWKTPLIVVAVVATATVGYVTNRSESPEEPTPTPATEPPPPLSAVGSEAPAPAVRPATSKRPPTRTPGAPPPRPAARPQAPEDDWHEVTRTTLANMTSLAMQQVSGVDGRNLNDYQARARTGDGEAAFVLFHKLVSCANAPETENVVLGRIEDFYEGAANNPDADKVMDQLSDHYVKKYQECENFPRGQAGMLEAYDWLQLALDLRFPPAMTAFVTHGKSIVMQGSLLRPELPMQYRQRVLDEMQSMLASGLGEAFVIHAREYSAGDLLEQDWFLAYAFAHAATLAEAGNHTGDHLLKEAERHLTPVQVRDARGYGRDLCERYCRN